MNKELKFLGNFNKKIIVFFLGGSGRGGLGRGGGGVRVDVNEELKILGKFKKKSGGGSKKIFFFFYWGGGGSGRGGGGSGWM